VVTFLFSDIVGSTALWEEDADAMATVMAGHDALIGAAVSDHGGVVVKSTGDGLMAAFMTRRVESRRQLTCNEAATASAWERARRSMVTGPAARSVDGACGLASPTRRVA
jgi:class 3 adenylate cyclase